MCFQHRQERHIATVCPGSKSSGLEQTGSTNCANWCEASNDWKSETNEQDLRTWMLKAENQQVLILGKPARRSLITVTVEVYEIGLSSLCRSAMLCYRPTRMEQFMVHGLIVLLVVYRK